MKDLMLLAAAQRSDWNSYLIPFVKQNLHIRLVDSSNIFFSTSTNLETAFSAAGGGSSGF